ncbi:hypothetical protein [Streptomyces sp. NPDC053542]|uniref:Rv1733c family protein n=1 Tax=Streptomyces sp. NPDC053542 TaxID=3365710 RepID=UPI0037CDC830
MSAQGSPYASGPHPPHQEHRSKGANPLRRTSDRIECWVARFLMLAFALGLPMASLGVGLTAYESAMRSAHAQAAERHAVAARLTSNADEAQDAEYVQQRARVRWTDKNGKERTGATLVKAGTREGATVRIWVDRDGAITSPPMTVHNATAMGWTVGGGTAVAVAAGLFAARAGTRLALDRRRYARWEAEWDLVEPHWSARFRQ